MGGWRLTHDVLHWLNSLVAPLWVYSCAKGRVLWANKSALAAFGGSLLDGAGCAIVDEEHARLLATVRDLVEVKGGELTLTGGQAGALPGVPPDAHNPGAEFAYQQVQLCLPGADALVCTMVQVNPATAAAAPRPPSALSAYMLPGPQSSSSTLRPQFHNTSDHAPLGPPSGGSIHPSPSGRLMRMHGKLALSMPEILDLVEGLLAGQPVGRDSLRALHSMLVHGELVIQASQAEDEVMAHEALPEDVGLNLLQLLGNSSEFSREPGSDTDLPPGLLALGGSDQSCPGAGGVMMNGGSGKLCTAGVAHSSSARYASSPGLPPTGSDGSSGGGHGSGAGDDDARSLITTLLPATDAVLATADEWRFDAFQLSSATAGHPLSALGFWLLKRMGLVDGMGLDAPSLARYLRRVEDSYPENPYHNKTHAADVLQSLHVIMTRGGLLEHLGDDRPLVLLAAYLSAVVHDAEHRGLNNDFLVRVGDDLALTYNDVSPMENHHVAVAFRLLRRPGLNFLSKLSRDRMIRLRKLVIDMVLATDMKSHFKILSLFQAKLHVRWVKLRSSTFGTGAGGHHDGSGGLGPRSGSGPGSSGLVLEDELDRSLVLQVALKCADVGHLAAPWDVHHKWVACLEEEFFRQGDKERALHLSTSPLMDRHKDGITKSQVGFFDIVALPLFYSWSSVFPDAAQLVRAVEDNCSRWRLVESGRCAKH